jgi:predicted metalloprotease
MNDQYRGDLPEQPDDDPDGQRRELAASLQRKLMERARIAAERDSVKPPSRLLQHSLALLAALVVVFVVVFGFNAFLTSMQKVMRMLDEQEQQQQQQEEQRQQELERQRKEKQKQATEPMPAYVVPPEQDS